MLPAPALRCSRAFAPIREHTACLANPALTRPRPNAPTDPTCPLRTQVKWTVKEFECNLTRDIVELVDREADLLNRGRSEASLEGLRKRLANLFLQFAHTPEFNPEAAHFQQVRRAPHPRAPAYPSALSRAQAELRRCDSEQAAHTCRRLCAPWPAHPAPNQIRSILRSFSSSSRCSRPWGAAASPREF